jgi:hypothetical protein
MGYLDTFFDEDDLVAAMSRCDLCGYLSLVQQRLLKR